jgi:hypothetical protein
MQVFASAIGRRHLGVARDSGGDPELDLRVV